jgi:hypothetical protein
VRNVRNRVATLCHVPYREIMHIGVKFPKVPSTHGALRCRRDFRAILRNDTLEIICSRTAFHRKGILDLGTAILHPTCFFFLTRKANSAKRCEAREARE